MVGEALASALLELAPRVRVEARGVVWADARGLPAPALAASLVARAGELGFEDVTAGVAAVAVAAEAAARVAAERAGVASTATSSPPASVPPGSRDSASAGGGGGAGEADRSVSGCRLATGSGPGGADAVAGGRVLVVEDARRFLANLPLGLVVPDDRLLELLEGVGVATCGELAALEREAVEVRFGAAGVDCWRLARGEDRRRLFAPIPRRLPHASVDFVDYVLTDPARLVFAANGLLGSICRALAGRGEHARRMTLRLDLAGGGAWERTLRAARPTASRETWLRRVRAVLDRITVPDAIAGIHLEVEATEAAAARQGDLFDPGFATAGAVEEAVARLIEGYGAVVVAPEHDAHPLAERRTRWRGRSPADAASGSDGSSVSRRGGGSGGSGRSDGSGAPGSRPGDIRPGAAGSGPAFEPGALTLQLLPEPRPITVETALRRDHEVPVRYRDGRAAHGIVTAAGPDRVSGDPWGEPFAREYFRCVTAAGVLVWIFRDRRGEAWFLHGWWD